MPYSLPLVPYPTLVLTLNLKWEQNVFRVKDGPIHFFIKRGEGGGELEDFENKIAREQAGKQISYRAQAYINPLQHLSEMIYDRAFVASYIFVTS